MTSPLSVPELTKQLRIALKTLPPRGEIDEEQRKALYWTCEAMKTHLEHPLETTARVIFGTHRFASLRLGIEIGVFDAMAKANGEARDVEQLAKETGAEPALVCE
jgi:hypothetical protein